MLNSGLEGAIANWRQAEMMPKAFNFEETVDRTWEINEQVKADNPNWPSDKRYQEVLRLLESEGHYKKNGDSYSVNTIGSMLNRYKRKNGLPIKPHKTHQKTQNKPIKLSDEEIVSINQQIMGSNLDARLKNLLSKVTLDYFGG